MWRVEGGEWSRRILLDEPPVAAYKKSSAKATPDLRAEISDLRSCEKTQNRFSITFFVVILKFFVVILNLIQNLSRDVKRYFLCNIFERDPGSSPG